eukprot:CAMPEP_0114520924 /NCGR_PEP_ID=MMETSP0109-20121206/19894_1 /TAXON_ID=29199 /ORGANISM="Chlorarachnion reptans, Strain CCCM449" /LENGTH=557 /DNA_ID=CAMNT_0001701959 /DNA_START=122 /DNA_END=1795 /DNA_ORIENTATION=+
MPTFAHSSFILIVILLQYSSEAVATTRNLHSHRLHHGLLGTGERRGKLVAVEGRKGEVEARLHTRRRLLTARRNSLSLSTRASNLNEIITSLFGGGGGKTGRAAVDFEGIPGTPANPNAAPSWEELGQALEDIVEKDDSLRVFLEDRNPVHPDRHPQAQARATMRLFDAPEGFEPEITLYRDSASWCPYCEKVWLLLEEKRIPYKVSFVPMSCYGRKPEEFLSIQPSGGIPVAVIRGRVISESNDIITEIERLFPDQNPMIPAVGTDEYKAFQTMLKLERRLFSSWFGWLVTGMGEREFLEMADETNGSLAEFGGPYFLGDQMSLVDCMFAPFLERMAASLPYYKGLVFRGNERWGNINRWFEAMEKRPSFQGIQSDYYTHVHDLPPQVGGCRSSGDYERYVDDIDGLTDSWKLPLPEGGSVEPVRPQDRNQKYARFNAAKALLDRHDKVVKFASRALGRGGAGVRAPLSDPYRNNEPRIIPHIDLALRIVANALLQENEHNAMKYAQEAVLSAGIPKDATAACLSYLRDRVGVPRDMNFSEARQLRAYLNLISDAL